MNLLATLTNHLLAMSEIWLAAHADPVANIHTFQSCMTLSNVYGQTNHQCVIADNGDLSWPPKLKVCSLFAPFQSFSSFPFYLIL